MTVVVFGRVFRAAACVAFAAAIAGCSSSSGRSPAAPPPLGPIPVITATDQVIRPVDAYLPSPDQVRTLMKAVDALQARCMRTYGLPSPQGQTGNVDQMAQILRAASPLYGFYNTEVPARLGYDRVQQAPVQNSSSTSPQSDSVADVLDGVDALGKAVTQYQGRAVPPGGCGAQALAAVGGPRFLTPMPASLPDGGPRVPASDSHLAAADAQWSACMKAKRYVYPTPDAAYSNPQWVPAGHRQADYASFVHTPQEIATMTADMDCKKSTNLMGVAVAVIDAYDRSYIASHASQLADFQRQLHAYLKQAGDLLASA